MVCDKEEAEDAGEEAGGTDLKTRAPHNDVGKKTDDRMIAIAHKLSAAPSLAMDPIDTRHAGKGFFNETCSMFWWFYLLFFRLHFASKSRIWMDMDEYRQN